MAKQYDSKKKQFNQKECQRVAKYLNEWQKEAFFRGAIDFQWCLTYVSSVNAAFSQQLTPKREKKR